MAPQVESGAGTSLFSSPTSLPDVAQTATWFVVSGSTLVGSGPTSRGIQSPTTTRSPTSSPIAASSSSPYSSASASRSVYITTTTIVGVTTSSVVVEIPTGSIFTPLPASTGVPVSNVSNNSGLSGWRAFLVAFFVIVLFSLFLRLAVYFLVRRGSATMSYWPRWMRILCCYRPPADEEEDFVEEPRFMRESYLEGGLSYPEVSRAQALALVRQASLDSWRDRLRLLRPRPSSPSRDDPVPPYPGPPLTPLENPFSDVSVSESMPSSDLVAEGKYDDEEASKEAEGARPSGSGRPQ